MLDLEDEYLRLFKLQLLTFKGFEMPHYSILKNFDYFEVESNKKID